MKISYSLLTLIFNVKGLMENIHIGEKYRALKNLELRLKINKEHECPLLLQPRLTTKRYTR